MTTETWHPSGDVVGLTDRPRLPRLGKIRLGIKKLSQRGAEYPSAVDYFVVPEVVQRVYGEKPRELDVVFPSDEIGRVAGVAWKQYTSTRGKVCTSDGEHAIRLVDIEKLPQRPAQEDFDKAIANAESKKVDWREIDCPAKDCVFAKRNLCKPVMNLMVMLPTVPGVGVYQLDTGSINSILDVRGGIELVMKLSGGRLAGIPLKLRIEPMEVISPDDQKKKVIHTLKLISPATLGKVLMAGERNLRELLMADEGSSRSVGLPQIGPGTHEVPTPAEPEEDLYPSSHLPGTPQSEAADGAPIAAAASRVSTERQASGSVRRERAAEDLASSSAAPHADLEARIYELLKELGVTAKDQGVYRNAYKGKDEELVAFLEKNLTKRKP